MCNAIVTPKRTIMAVRVAGLLLAMAVAASANNLYNLTAVDIHGNAVQLSNYRGNVSVVLNVATY
eukprot:m.89704 g.89704  ORF g.89704 m.89704 type:complete len:65 (-) comp14981_c0_seq7:992-1186(-)